MAYRTVNLWDSPYWLAFMTGLYLTIFYVTNNSTLLSFQSIIGLALVLITPVFVVISTVHYILTKLGRAKTGCYISTLASVFYLIALLRLPLLEIEYISSSIRNLGSMLSLNSNIVYVAMAIFLAAICSLLFSEKIGNITIILAIVSITAIVPKLASANINPDQKSSIQYLLENTRLKSKPNIYFVVADSYASFLYLQEKNIDTSSFRDFLSHKNFKIYKDTYSNYQPTTSAIPAMLNMEHHYYTLSEDLVDPFALSQQFSEVSKSGRIIAGGNNNLVSFLRNNSYEIHYIHHREYLLLHGCSADYCFPNVSAFQGAKNVLHRILPQSIFPREKAKESVVLENFQNKVIELIEQRAFKGNPIFQYIHLYNPGHSPNEENGVCDEAIQLAEYSERIKETSRYLETLLERLITTDPEATIVLAGDHGPFISQNCAQKADLRTPEDYRDRASAILSIRWPKSYDGRYDSHIQTTINMFKYLLASITDNDSGIISTVTEDDVYIHGKSDILRIMENGKLLKTPKHFSKGELKTMSKITLCKQTLVVGQQLTDGTCSGLEGAAIQTSSQYEKKSRSPWQTRSN